MNPLVETEQQRHDRIKERFGVLRMFTDAMLNGLCRAMIVSGPGGLGKSFGVEQALKKWDPTGNKYTINHGYMRPTGLLKLTWKHRAPGDVVVIDDADSVFGDDVSLNILKAVCDTCEDRTVTWLSQKGLWDEDSGQFIPSRFDFEGSFIFLTNIDFDQKIDKGTALSHHYEALVTRAHYVDLAMRGIADYLTRIDQVVEEGLLRHLSKSEVKDVMKFVHDHAYDTQFPLREVSLRVPIKIGQLRQEFPKDWASMARITCCKNR